MKFSAYNFEDCYGFHVCNSRYSQGFKHNVQVCLLFPDHTEFACRRGPLLASIKSEGRLHLKCDGTHAETRFLLSAKRTSPFKSAGRQFTRLLAAQECVSAVVMLDTPCSEVVWRVLAIHSTCQFPLHFPSRALQCAITFQLDSSCLSATSVSMV